MSNQCSHCGENKLGGFCSWCDGTIEELASSSPLASSVSKTTPAAPATAPHDASWEDMLAEMEMYLSGEPLPGTTKPLYDAMRKMVPFVRSVLRQRPQQEIERLTEKWRRQQDTIGAYQQEREADHGRLTALLLRAESAEQALAALTTSAPADRPQLSHDESGGTEPPLIISEPTMQPHNDAATDHWECVCLECQISSRVERYPEIATPSARLAALRSIVAWDIWPIDVDCLSVGEHNALKTATKILPALLRDLEYYQQIGSGNQATHAEPAVPTSRSAAQGASHLAGTQPRPQIANLSDADIEALMMIRRYVGAEPEQMRLFLRWLRTLPNPLQIGTQPRPDWQPIIVSAPPGEPIVAAQAWLYEPSCGVRLGSFGRFSDGVAFGSVPGMNGCFVRDWGATHWQPAEIPAPPEAK